MKANFSPAIKKKKREMGKRVELGGTGKGLRVNKIKIYCSMNEILKELKFS